MKALHLFSNYKFTGPADPAMLMAAALGREGVEVTFMAGRGTGSQNDVAAIARRRGLATEEILQLRRHGKPLSLIHDVAKLRKHVVERPYDLVHAHLQNDHLIACLATGGKRPVVRTIYDAVAPLGFRARVSLSRTRGVLVFGSVVEEDLRRTYPGWQGVLERIDPAVDLERIVRPRRPELRAELIRDAGDIVLGVVARMQTHRLFAELIEGFSRAARRDERLRLVILGRGTHQETVAREPARSSGVADRILFPGYIPNESYPDYLACFDALVFLVPGSDGTCRAVREALVAGLPVIASRRGLLPELVRDGENGWLLREESPEEIARVITNLAASADERSRLGRQAAEDGHRRFDPGRQAAKVCDFYRRVLGE